MKYLSSRPCRGDEIHSGSGYKPMEHELVITRDAVDEAAWMARRRRSSEMGAAVYFVGVVRGTEEGKSIDALEYEVFERMAAHQFGLIFQAMARRWPIAAVRVVHRAGPVQVGEAAVCVEVLAAHRGEAFAACQYLIEQMKQVVPIWKRIGSRS